MNHHKLLVVQVAGLSHGLARQLTAFNFMPMQTVYPALTCPVQGSFRTALAPAEHGMQLNGVYSPELNRPFYWEQSSRLVRGTRIWEPMRAKGKTVAIVCWQQSLGEAADYIISPAPIHKHHGSLIKACACKPATLIQGTFPLHRYWGPLASDASTRWIVNVTANLIRQHQPDLCLTYLPTLDYDLQRKGTDPKGLRQILEHLTTLRGLGYPMLVFGDYAITPASDVIYPNRILRKLGLLQTRSVNGMLYPDFHNSQAFAMVDHAVCRIIGDIPPDTPLAPYQTADGLYLAPEGSWFAYPWWYAPYEAPDYAGHIDIHNKPGYDPAELFLFNRKPERIRGTHGSNTPPAAYAAVNGFHAQADTLLELAGQVRDWINA